MFEPDGNELKPKRTHASIISENNVLVRFATPPLSGSEITCIIRSNLKQLLICVLLSKCLQHGQVLKQLHVDALVKDARATEASYCTIEERIGPRTGPGQAFRNLNC